MYLHYKRDVPDNNRQYVVLTIQITSMDRNQDTKRRVYQTT